MSKSLYVLFYVGLFLSYKAQTTTSTQDPSTQQGTDNGTNQAPVTTSGQDVDYVKAQPPWIQDNEFVVPDVINGFKTATNLYVKIKLGIFTSKAGVSYPVTGVKTEKWCFLKFKDGTEYRPFFFQCDLLTQSGEIFLRDMGTTCPYPIANTAQPPTGEKCKMFNINTSKLITELTDAIGSNATADILGCLIDSKPGKPSEDDLDFLCMRDAAISGWHAIKGSDYVFST